MNKLASQTCNVKSCDAFQLFTLFCFACFFTINNNSCLKKFNFKWGYNMLVISCSYSDYKVQLINSTSNKTGFLIDGEEVKNIFKQEWKKSLKQNVYNLKYLILILLLHFLFLIMRFYVFEIVFNKCNKKIYF